MLGGVYILMAAMLVLGTLMTRREPWAKLLTTALMWISIFSAGFVLLTFRDNFGWVGQRLRAEAIGAPVIQGHETRIPMAIDGHFWVEGLVNGIPVKFLVDSGATMTTVDRIDLESKVKDMYRRVAEQPDERYHFEMGRGLAERLGYPPGVLDRIPAAAIESFAGVGYFHDLADLRAGERVVDLGSGSGTDSFVAATLVGPSGRVIGVDFTAEQLAKARRLAADAGLAHVEFREGRIETLPGIGRSRNTSPIAS